MKGALAALVLLAAVVVPASDASFNARSSNAVAIGAASATTYFHLYARDELPPPDPGCWLFQYAVRRGSNPQVLAASGSDRTIAVHLGGWRGQQARARCVLAIRAPSAFPPGVGQITLQTLIAADLKETTRTAEIRIGEPPAGWPSTAAAEDALRVGLRLAEADETAEG